MALNVLSMRRSSPPYKANRRFAVGWNVGEKKTHKAVGDCGFSNPKGPNSARSAYCLLSAGKTTTKHLPRMAGVNIKPFPFLHFFYL